MSNRFDAAGAQAWRARLGWALAALLSGWTVAAGDAQAERFVLSSGETVDGTIVAATRNTVVVRRSIGGMRQMATEDIAEVRFDLAGGRLAGEFLRWADGVYELGVGDEVVRLDEGGIVSRAPRQAAAPRREFPSAPERQQQIAAAHAHPPGEAAVLAAEDPVDVATLAVSEAAADGPSAAPVGGTGDREAGARIGAERAAGANTARGDESAAASEQASRAGDDAGGLTIKARVDPPAAGERSLVFKIELSEPAAQSVVLIYGTVDGTAKAGQDYEARQGMVTLAPGEQSAEVRVPLLAKEAQDDEKRFELVLMGDPKVADILDRRVIATIKGVD